MTMNEDERLQHIGELKECLAGLLSILEPIMVHDLVLRSEADELRRQADRLDVAERIKQRARELIAMKVGQ
jgi:hypothetical protein